MLLTMPLSPAVSRRCTNAARSATRAPSPDEDNNARMSLSPSESKIVVAVASDDDPSLCVRMVQDENVISIGRQHIAHVYDLMPNGAKRIREIVRHVVVKQECHCRAATSAERLKDRSHLGDLHSRQDIRKPAPWSE